MKLKEFLGMVSEGSNVRATVDGEYIVSYYYDANGEIDDEYSDYKVNSFFATTIGGDAWISVDLHSKYRIEIWDNEAEDDWAQVSINKETGIVTAVITSYWESASYHEYDEVMEIFKEDGYTKLRDTYDSWEEYNDYISLDSEYDYL